MTVALALTGLAALVGNILAFCFVLAWQEERARAARYRDARDDARATLAGVRGERAALARNGHVDDVTLVPDE